MTTLADLRDRLRIELHDGDETRWEDETLDRHLQRAIRELSSRAPHELKTTLMATAGSRELSLSTLSGLIEVTAVEYPLEQYPPGYVRYSVYSDTLTLLIEGAPAESEEVTVYWGGVHEVDDEGSTLPAIQEEIAVLGAAAYAAIEWASFATNRANAGGSEVVQQYGAWGADALSRFQAQLARLREVSRVRTSSLYSPADRVLPRSVVQFEA